MIKRPLVFYIPLAFAASLLFTAWYLRHPHHGIGAASVFVPLGAVLSSLAIVYFRSAPDIAAMLEERNANKHPIFRLWLPASLFSAKALLWPLRVTGIIAVLLGLEFVALGILLLVRYQ